MLVDRVCIVTCQAHPVLVKRVSNGDPASLARDNIYDRKLISQQVGAQHYNHAIGKWSDAEEDDQDEEE